MMRLGIVMALSLAGISLANTVAISYAGGKQTGSFDMRGSTGSLDTTTWSYPDTVVIDGAVRIITFTEVWNSRRSTYAGSRRYWIFLENDSGTSGYLNASDTVWANALSFPAGVLRHDTLTYNPDPLPAFADQLSPSNLSGVHAGLQAGTRNYGGEGYVNGFSLDMNRRRILYFGYDMAGAPRYGKLMIHDMRVRTSTFVALADGPRIELEKVTIAYTLSNSSDLNSGAVVGVASTMHAIRSKNRSLIWSGKEGVLIRDAKRPDVLFDLKGKRRIPSHR